MIPKLSIHLLSLVFLLSLIACSKKNLSHDASCNLRYETLHTQFEKGKYAQVREPLSNFLTECSGSQFAEQAQYELAESHYRLKDWILAKSEFEYLLRSFPATRYGEEASFKSARCTQHQMYSVNRDQTHTQEALQEYQDFLLDYSYSTWSDSARQQIGVLRSQLAKKELNIAKLYRKRDEYLASAIYLKSALRNYRDVIDTHQVRLQLASCYSNLNQLDEAKTYLNEVQLQKEHPLYSMLEGAKEELADKEKELSKKRAKAKVKVVDEF
jgi:outer membrane protein assembly factor BamD